MGNKNNVVDLLHDVKSKEKRYWRKKYIRFERGKENERGEEIIRRSNKLMGGVCRPECSPSMGIAVVIRWRTSPRIIL